MDEYEKDTSPAPRQSFGSAPDGDQEIGEAPRPTETIGDAPTAPPAPAGRGGNMTLLVGGVVAVLVIIAAIVGFAMR